MKALPNTSFLPVPKSAPAGHTTAAAHLLWQVFRYPCLEYKDNSGQSCPVRYTWTASFGRGLMFWQKRFNLTPQFVAYQFPGHLLHPHWYFTAYSSICQVLFCQVLLGALNHFVTVGMSEGRQGNKEFNLSIYKANNPDLVSAFGDDNTKYYEHYISTGKAEGRKAA